MIVSDNGTELTSNAVLAWLAQIGVDWHYIGNRPIGTTCRGLREVAS